MAMRSLPLFIGFVILAAGFHPGIYADEPKVAAAESVTPGFDPPIETIICQCEMAQPDLAAVRAFIRHWGPGAAPVLIKMYREKHSPSVLLDFMGELPTEEIKAFYAERFRAAVVEDRQYTRSEAWSLLHAASSLVSDREIALAIDLQKEWEFGPSGGPTFAPGVTEFLIANGGSVYRDMLESNMLDEANPHRLLYMGFMDGADPDRAMRIAERVLVEDKKGPVLDDFVNFLDEANTTRARCRLSNEGPSPAFLELWQKHEEELAAKKKDAETAAKSAPPPSPGTLPADAQGMLAEWRSHYRGLVYFANLDDVPVPTESVREEMAARVTRALADEVEKDALNYPEINFLVLAAERLKAPEALPALIGFLRKDNPPQDRRNGNLDNLDMRAASTCADLYGEKAASPLIALVDDDSLSPKIRRMAAIGLARIGSGEAVQKLSNLYANARSEISKPLDPSICTHGDRMFESASILFSMFHDSNGNNDPGPPIRSRNGLDVYLWGLEPDFMTGQVTVFWDIKGKEPTRTQERAYLVLHRFGNEWFVTGMTTVFDEFHSDVYHYGILPLGF